MKQIIIVKPNTILKSDKQKLSNNNFIVIEHPFPWDVRILYDLKESETLQSALKAMEAEFRGNDSGIANQFGRNIIRTLLKK